MKLLAPISVGEIFDKLSILQIKEEKILNSEKLSNIKNEIEGLRKTINDTELDDQTCPKMLAGLKKKLYDTNLTLWNIEDKLRRLENQKDFGEEFISLARQVYITNDMRASIKKEINELTGSEFTEEKHYSKY